MTRADAEAADWLVRLARPLVAQDDLVAFRAWREDAAHDTAFRHQQDVWRRAGRLPPDPQLQGAVMAARARRPRRAAVLRRGTWAAGVGAAVVGGLAVVILQPETYATAVGERSQVRLADGSAVMLDADSRITVSLGRSARSVRLMRGQALFDVAHDTRRPFTVIAGDLRVTAVGTRFDIRREAGGGARVTLLQGRVQVLAGRGEAATRLALAPGQETSTIRPRAVAARTDDEVAWTAGRLVFHSQPLVEVVAETNRYSRRRLRLESGSRLDAVRITGSFNAGDTGAVAQALADLYDLKVGGDPDGTVVLRPG